LTNRNLNSSVLKEFIFIYKQAGKNCALVDENETIALEKAKSYCLTYC